MSVTSLSDCTILWNLITSILSVSTSEHKGGKTPRAADDTMERGGNIQENSTFRVLKDYLHITDIVVVGDKLVMTDTGSKKVRVYRSHDGMLLSSTDELESYPWRVCCVNDTDLCVVMSDGTITLMSVSNSGLISRGTTFQLVSLQKLLDRARIV
ncbi:hypothetical protein CHS0354_032634 [Potamilus streckersoni]|uniref:Uncharacterized protein n=1 Tax=Potamilus streckersoni TaxID=2493646 RepID=A0AAE0SFC8_9BIVA|nr:hypothetical protein CHS0354_032634 [Potamilus streckersoni]